KVPGLRSGYGGCQGSGSGWAWEVAGYLVRVLILSRLWAKTPWPHQIAAPDLVSRRVRSQPEPRLRELMRPSPPGRHLTRRRERGGGSVVGGGGGGLAGGGGGPRGARPACRGRP